LRNNDSWPVVLKQVQGRWLVRSISLSVAAAGVAFAIAIVLGSISIAIGAALVVAAVMSVRGRSLSSVEAALMIERALPMANLLVTTAELDARPRPVRAEIREAIDRQVRDRLPAVDSARVVPLAQPVAVAVAVVFGCGVLTSLGAPSITTSVTRQRAGNASVERSTALSVRVTPPSYTKRTPEVFDGPVQVTVIAGSRIQIDSGGEPLRNWIAAESAAIEIRSHANAQPRFLSVIVVPDAAPMLRIVTPGKDTAFAAPSGQVPIRVESRDDIGLSSLALRFTKASGGGENLSFMEGEVPLRLERTNDRQWRAQANLSLEALKLEDGDIIVYRAIARDTNPAGSPVQSEQYLIEIGKNAAIVDAGFALPTEEKKYAISQQMVIYKTEQLISSRSKHADDWLDQTRLIAMEQRMVRAEVVFLGGGEVEDELEEAAKSDELTEGRLQNTGRAEMLRAINAMSRAEAQLNDGRAAEALVFERQALASLERALDRRRYFLRTLPDRSRIDAARRLIGERGDARSWMRDFHYALPDDAPAGARQVMNELAAAAANPADANAALASRVAAVDPSSKELQDAAVAIASASSGAARIEALHRAMKALTAHALKALAASAGVDLRDASLSGALTEQLARRPRQ
jgi:hypothetical protein